jgi:hypothetical protein
MMPQLKKTTAARRCRAGAVMMQLSLRDALRLLSERGQCQSSRYGRFVGGCHKTIRIDICERRRCATRVHKRSDSICDVELDCDS